VAKKKWSDLAPTQRRAIGVGGVLEAILTAAALRDLARRSADEVRGPKAAWALAFVVQPFGPIGYFAVGRR
jgi:hypothetical protein